MKNGLIGIGLCVGALAGCAAEKPAPRPALASPARAATPPPALPSGNVEQTLTGTATVQKAIPDRLALRGGALARSAHVRRGSSR